jgi:hypothetical protein
MIRQAGLAAVGRLAKEEARRTELRIALQLVSDMRRRCARDVAAMELHSARTVGATKLGILIA